MIKTQQKKEKKNMLRRERGLMAEHLLKHICSNDL